jgi:glycosyltransferase involved in cell wall biosynthesis
LKYATGIIIQDQLRLQALLEGTPYPNLRVFYLPVSIPGKIITTRSNYFHNKFQLRPDQKIVLYFGAVYDERKIDQLVEAFTKMADDDLVLLLHGGNAHFAYDSLPANIKISNEHIPYHNLHMLISGATIGIALYDNGWPNTRFTAFSSEKIARYLQAGVPFIAFANESYFNLKNEFDCCELIDQVEEIVIAIGKLQDNYEYYRQNCFRAYEKYYNIEHTVKPLCAFVLS